MSTLNSKWGSPETIPGYGYMSGKICPISGDSTCDDTTVSWALTASASTTAPAPPTDAATCRIFYGALDKAKAKSTTNLADSYKMQLTCSQRHTANWYDNNAFGTGVNAYSPPPSDWPSTCPSTGTYNNGLYDCTSSCTNYYYLCCTKPRDPPETLGQCCGVLKSTQVCLSPQATVGVLGGYVSLWFSICQAIYSGLALLYDYSGMHSVPSKAHEDEKSAPEECVFHCTGL